MSDHEYTTEQKLESFQNAVIADFRATREYARQTRQVLGIGVSICMFALAAEMLVIVAVLSP